MVINDIIMLCLLPVHLSLFHVEQLFTILDLLSFGEPTTLRGYKIVHVREVN